MRASCARPHCRPKDQKGKAASRPPRPCGFPSNFMPLPEQAPQFSPLPLSKEALGCTDGLQGTGRTARTWEQATHLPQTSCSCHLVSAEPRLHTPTWHTGPGGLVPTVWDTLLCRPSRNLLILRLHWMSLPQVFSITQPGNIVPAWTPLLQHSLHGGLNYYFDPSWLFNSLGFAHFVFHTAQKGTKSQNPFTCIIEGTQCWAHNMAPWCDCLVDSGSLYHATTTVGGGVEMQSWGKMPR